MRRMSAGDGYKYLLKSVVYGDGDRAMSTPLTRYYSEEGTPPGRWLASGRSSPVEWCNEHSSRMSLATQST